jgi:putative ABC transport system permease protein
MTVLASIRVAIDAIRQNALRSTLTMLGIMIGVAAVIVMVAVGTGSQRRVQQQIDSLGANLLMVRPGHASVGGVRLGAGTRVSLTEDDAAAINREIDTVAAAGVVWWSGGQAVRGNRNWNVRIHGVDPHYLTARNRSVVRGRPLRREDVERTAKVAFLGQRVVDELFGDEEPVGGVIRLRNVPFVVAGVLDIKGQTLSGRSEDNIIYVPVSTARVAFARTLVARPRAVSAITGTARYAAAGTEQPVLRLTPPRRRTTLKEIRARSVSAIYIKAWDADAIPVVQREVVRLLRQRHRLQPGTPDDFRVRDLTVVARARKNSTDVLAAMLAAIAGVSLLVGGIGIMNIMLVSVTERRREIGLRMALGARRVDVLRQFLVEATTLSLAGGLAGIAIGIAGASVVAQTVGVEPAVEPLSVLIAFLFAGAVGVAFGYYPARRASKLDPIVALRHE